MTTKLADPVRTDDGEVTTIDALAKAGRIEFRKVDNFYTRRGVSTKYFADLDGTTSGWEISKAAYLSRTGQKSALATLFGARAQCCHYDDWHKESTRCQHTTETDPLSYFLPERLGRYCSEHGPQIGAQRSQT